MIKGKIQKYNFRPIVIGEQISKVLTDAIMEGTLKGGDQLVETELQEFFGISRSPLREAFRDLEKKGLVVILPRKGTFVKQISREDIEENFPVRAVLEELAAKIAFNRMTATDLEEMDNTLENMKKAVKENDTKAYWEQHLIFHEIFINASGNHVLIGLLTNLRLHSMWYRFSYQYYEKDLEKSLEVHQLIYDLFRGKKDQRKLVKTVQNHIEEALDTFLLYLESQKEQKDET